MAFRISRMIAYLWIVLIVSLSTSTSASTLSPDFVECGVHEKDTSKDDCLSACEPSCDAPIQKFCIMMCAQRNCTCEDGYYRNKKEECVEWKNCPDYKTYNPCSKPFTCPKGEKCTPTPKDCTHPPCPPEAVCSGVSRRDGPPLPFTDCSVYSCNRCGDRCTMVNDQALCKEECKQHPLCVPKDVKTCEDKNACPEGKKCKMVPIQCFKCPCWPKLECY